MIIFLLKINAVFFHYIIAKKWKEGYLLRLYEFMTIIEQLYDTARGDEWAVF